MNARNFLPVVFILAAFLSSCEIVTDTSPPVLGPSPTPPLPTDDPGSLGLTEAEIATLQSLDQINDYPLYTMQYVADYDMAAATFDRFEGVSVVMDQPWACSLFVAFADPNNLLYGRNFDWEYSPALLLFTEPSDGYASAAMVDIAFLGFTGREAVDLTAQPLNEIRSLLGAPQLPFDGLNEMGLAVGMAAVSPGNLQTDPSKPTIGSLGIIREVLDHASRVEEAVEIMAGFNIDFTGGPPVHYLIADRYGDAVLVEYYLGKMELIRNQYPWHLATNFLRSATGSSGEGQCRRYDALSQTLTANQGLLTSQGALDLLAQVSQDSTQWSIVYNLASGEIQVVMGQVYYRLDLLHLGMADGEAGASD